MREAVTMQDLLWNDVQRHLSEAQALWGRWESGLAAPDRTMRALASDCEERLIAHLEGLRLGGLKAIVELLLPALASDDPGRLAATAFVMSTIPPGREPLVTAFFAARGPRLAALRRGVELGRMADFVAVLEGRFTAAPLPVRAAVLDIKRFWREDPGPHTFALLLSEDLDAQIAAARAVRHHRSELAFDRAIDVAMIATQPEVRNAALESGLYVGQAEAWSACLQTVRAGAPGHGPLLLLVALLGTVADHRLVIEALGDEETRRDALWALGFAGSRAAADACIDLLAQDLHPRLAAEALCAITGLDLPREKLALAPEDQENQENQENQEARTAEERLPRPDIPGVIRWWNANRDRFTPDQRYIDGRPRNADRIQEVLERGATRRRAPLALEMSIRTARRYLVTPTAFTPQQVKEMAAFGELEVADFRRHPHARSFSPI
jgi:uncharacterized protein (TIGR02270 family)